MSDTVVDREVEADVRLGIVDCDIHPGFSRKGELSAYLPARWRSYVEDYGLRNPNPLSGTLPYPRMGHGMRQDSYPPGGGAPASDLAFMQQQLLDPLDIEVGLLHALNAGPAAFSLELGNAVCGAVNDWQVDKWLSRDRRLRGGITCPQEDADAAVREIEARAADKRFVQVSMVPRSLEPAGRKKYWPIYEAAASLGLPVGVHTAAYGVHANSASGWASFYIEEHSGYAHPAQTFLVSMIFEGVFERFPDLKLVIVEGGFAWLAPLMWRMDREWDRMRDEVPQVKRKPSDYVKSNVWLTTQPVEEPRNVRHMSALLDWIGHDRLLFSTDYPHWDFDHPDRVFRVPLDKAQKQAFFRDTARAVYNLD